MNWKSFISFERMVTPVIIKVLFWIGMILSIIGGVIVFFSAVITGISDGDVLLILGGLIGGPLSAIVGILLVRIYCELLILFFRINETLTDIKKLLAGKAIEQ